jgi:hypothetical protein
LGNIDPRLMDTPKGQMLAGVVAQTLAAAEADPSNAYRRTFAGKDGSFTTEVIVPGLTAFGDGDRWFSDRVWSRFSSDEQGVPQGDQISVSTTLNDGGSSRIIDKGFVSVDNGKKVYDEQVSVQMMWFGVDHNPEPSFASTHTKGGNFYGDHQAYDNDPQARQVVDAFVKAYTAQPAVESAQAPVAAEAPPAAVEVVAGSEPGVVNEDPAPADYSDLVKPNPESLPEGTLISGMNPDGSAQVEPVSAKSGLNEYGGYNGVRPTQMPGAVYQPGMPVKGNMLANPQQGDPNVPYLGPGDPRGAVVQPETPQPPAPQQ